MNAISILLSVEADAWNSVWPEDEAEAALIRALDAGLAEARAAGKPEWLETLSGKEGFEVSVMLADDETVRELNRDYRGKDKPTNILSFPQFAEAEAPAMMPGHDCILLGDLALSFETVEREAKARDIGIADHVAHLMVHGFLHLLGYDHDTDARAQHMEQLEIKALERLGLDDPYRFDQMLMAADASEAANGSEPAATAMNGAARAE
jgi:probable rRNA maturation factor